MNIEEHQMMGYDRAITLFSPEGRLLQVEYAKKTVSQGSTAIGLTCKDGVVFVTDKRIVDPLVVAEEVEKIFEIDSHIGATASGIISDARVLIERAQLVAQQHRVTYDTPIDVLSVVKDICALNQSTTQSGGLRPFGVSLLIGGVDMKDKPSLYKTDPTGIFFKYYACVIGEGEKKVEEYLIKNYKFDKSLDETIKLGLLALSKVLPENSKLNRIDVAVIPKDTKKFKRLSHDDIKKYYDPIKKDKN